MPWKNHPEWWQFMVLVVSTSFAVIVGTLTRITDQMRSGERPKFWTRRLFVDALGVAFMILVCIGIVDHFALRMPVAVAVSVVMGRAGPPAIDRLTEAYLARKESGK